MDYTACYNRIIHKAQSRHLTSGYETHHIVPKCLGGPNNKSNLVRLTIKEHFVCHRLLTKMHQGLAKQKMSFAFYRLCNRHQIKNSRAYETAKNEVRKALSDIHTGKTISEQHKQAIRSKCRGMVGRKHADDSLATMRQKKLGNTFAKVGVNIVDEQGCIVKTFPSIADLCKEFDLTRGQVEHYIYQSRRYKGLLFQRQKVITR